MRVVVEQAEPFVQAIVVQEAIAANADRARLGDDFAAVGADQRVVGELQVAHEVELARGRQQRQPRAGDVQLEQAQVARVAVVQPVAFEVERLDVAGAIGDKEDLAFFENGPLEDGAGLGPAMRRSASSELNDFFSRLADADQLNRRFEQHLQAADVGLRIGGQVGPAAGAGERLVPAGETSRRRADNAPASPPGSGNSRSARPSTS